MLHKISGILSGTPTWVFFIFAYLVFIGTKATKDRIVHVGKMFLMPGIFFALFWIKLIITWRLDIYALFFIALIVSLLISHFFIKYEQLKVHGKYVFVNGSYETLIIVMIIFTIKYYFGYMKAVNGEQENI
jgi:membrane protein CcdC involved in cytochrome C biogenesis